MARYKSKETGLPVICICGKSNLISYTERLFVCEHCGNYVITPTDAELIIEQVVTDYKGGQ